MNSRKDQLRPRLEGIIKHIEQVPIDFSNKKNVERMLAFLDYCYDVQEIREKVIASPMIMFSLLECLDTIDYENIDNFEPLYDVWRISIKYFNTPDLGKQESFEKLRKVIWSKCCLLHNLSFLGIPQLRAYVRKAGATTEQLIQLAAQYNVVFEGDIKSVSEEDFNKFLAVIFFSRIKLLNLILTFYNIILESQGGPDSQNIRLFVEMTVISETTVHEMERKEDTLNFSMLTPVLDRLMTYVNQFKLWDFTSTIAETMYLVQKLIDFTGTPNTSSKIVYNYLLRLIDVDISVKTRNSVDIRYFGEEEPRTRMSRPEMYLKHVMNCAEILPASEAQAEYSLVMLLQKIFESYDIQSTYPKIFTESLYLSFVITLARCEVNFLSLQFIDGIFRQFELNYERYKSNVLVMFQLVFLKRLIIYYYDENDIFNYQSVHAFYTHIFDKFDEYIQMLRAGKLRIRKKKLETDRNMLYNNSIKNKLAIRTIEEEIRKLSEEDGEIQGSVLTNPSPTDHSEE